MDNINGDQVTRAEDKGALKKQLNKIPIEFTKCNQSLLNSLEKSQHSIFSLKHQVNTLLRSGDSISSLFYCITLTEPQLLSSSSYQAYVLIEVMDVDFLENKMGLIIEVGKKYVRDLDFGFLKLPSAKEIILIDKAILLNGCEENSRNAFLLPNQGNFINLRKLGIPKDLIYCESPKCNIIIKKNLNKKCEKHLLSTLESLQGSRMELSHSTAGIKLHQVQIKGYGSFTQYNELPFYETYILDDNTRVTLYHKEGYKTLNKAEREKKELADKKIKGLLCKEDNAGADMLKAALEVNLQNDKKDWNLKQIKEYEKSNKRSHLLSVEACTMLAKKMVKQEEKKTSKPKKDIKPIQYFSRFSIMETIKDTKKLNEIISNNDKIEELNFSENTKTTKK